MSAQDILITVNGGVDPALAPQVVPSFDISSAPGVSWTMGDLVSGTDTLRVEATNLGTSDLEAVGLWISLATVSGAYDVRNHQPPQSDFVHMIFLGDSAADAGGPMMLADATDVKALATYASGGLWVSEGYDSAGSPSGWYRVNSQRGHSMATRISGVTLQAESANTIAWDLVLDDPGTGATRFYYDITIEPAVSSDAS